MVSKFVSVFALIGLSFANKIGDKGDDPARCHIYHEGEYGSCGYQVTHNDEWGTCGDSVANACISTYQPDMSGGDDNCGACWKLTVTYEDNVQLCTFIKSIDIDGSEAKFEMSQLAWKNVCPYVCDGYGNCAHNEASCPLGVMAVDQDFAASNAPTSCHVDTANVAWEMIDCNSGMSGCASGGSGPAPPAPPTPVQPTQAPYPPVQPTQAPYPPYPPQPVPTQAPYPPPYPPQPVPTQAPYPPPYPPQPAPTQAPYPPPYPPQPAPSGGSCWSPNSQEWKTGVCVTCPVAPVAQGSENRCPSLNSPCYTSYAACCADCVSVGYCNPSKCK